MSTTVAKPPPIMTVADFLDWPGDELGRRYELVDGVGASWPIEEFYRGTHLV